MLEHFHTSGGGELGNGKAGESIGRNRRAQQGEVAYRLWGRREDVLKEGDARKASRLKETTS